MWFLYSSSSGLQQNLQLVHTSVVEDQLSLAYWTTTWRHILRKYLVLEAFQIKEKWKPLESITERKISWDGWLGT